MLRRRSTTAALLLLVVLLVPGAKGRAQGGTQLLSLAPSGTLVLDFLLKPAAAPRLHGRVAAAPTWSSTPPDQKLGAVTHATLHVGAAELQQGHAVDERGPGVARPSDNALARSDSAELSIVVSAAGARELQAWAAASQRTGASADISIREVDLVSAVNTGALHTHVLHEAVLRALSLGASNGGAAHVAQLSVVFGGYGDDPNGSASGVSNPPVNRKH